MEKKILNFNGFYFNAYDVTAYYIERLHNIIPEEQRVNTKDVSCVVVIFNNGINRFLVPTGDITCDQLINNITLAITSDDIKHNDVELKPTEVMDKHNISFKQTASKIKSKKANKCKRCRQ